MTAYWFIKLSQEDTGTWVQQNYVREPRPVSLAKTQQWRMLSPLQDHGTEWHLSGVWRHLQTASLSSGKFIMESQARNSSFCPRSFSAEWQPPSLPTGREIWRRVTLCLEPALPQQLTSEELRDWFINTFSSHQQGCSLVPSALCFPLHLDPLYQHWSLCNLFLAIL